MTTKEIIIKTIECLPDDVSISEIVTCIKSLESIKESDRQLDRGEGIEHALVMARMKKLL